MPRKKSPDTPMVRTQDGRGEWYQSQKDYNAKYEREVTANIRLRVPKSWPDKIKEYVYLEDGGGYGKYNSVNDMICRLIAREVGLQYPDAGQAELLDKLSRERKSDKS